MDQIVQKFRKAVIFYHVYKRLLYFFPPKFPAISVLLSPIGQNPDNTKKEPLLAETNCLNQPSPWHSLLKQHYSKTNWHH